MGELRDRMENDMTLARYSAETRRLYLHYARQFARHFMRSPGEMGSEEVRQYLLHLINERRFSHTTIRQARAALIFLYTVTLGREVEVSGLPKMRREPRRLAWLLSGSEVERLLACVRDEKHRVVIMTMYSAGLRVREACSLRAEDIDSRRMVLWVRCGKGGKDRCTVLSHRLLEELRDYWRRCRPRPDGWLFPGSRGDGHVTPESVRAATRLAARDAGIPKRVTPHSLRHAFATHLLEYGVEMRVIQALMGHSSSGATQVYTHMTVHHIARTPSPLDVLGTPRGAVMG
jgi:integrase/recombinase XerD